jgi:hypothetical protein
MPKQTERGWILFKYVKRKLTPLSEPFKTKQQAEQARAKYPERERRKIGMGLVQGK